MDIVVTGYAGFEGSKAIYDDKVLGRRLKERYSESFFGVFSKECTEPFSAATLGYRPCDSGDAYGLTGSNPEAGSRQEAADILAAGGASQEIDRLFNSYIEEGLAADGAEGGVLAALWRVLKNNNKGGMYALRDIPVIQQTVEVCEMYSLNPYRLYAPGCRVWLSTDTGALAQAAADAGVPLSVIGFTSKGVAIRRTDTDADSSLRRPEEDELYKLFTR